MKFRDTLFICIACFLIDYGCTVCIQSDDHLFQNQSGTVWIKIQDCKWRLPNNNYLYELLFVLIPPFNFYNETTGCMADIALDAQALPCITEEPMCFLYNANLATIDFNYVKEQTKSYICKVWRIEEKRLNIIYTRTFQDQKQRNFSIRYQYISPFSSIQESTPRSTFEKTSTTNRNETCSNCTGYIVALSFAIVILLLLLIALGAFYLFIKQTMVGRRQPRIRGSFFQTESIDDEVDQHAPMSPPSCSSILKSIRRSRDDGSTKFFSKDKSEPKLVSMTNRVENDDARYYQVPNPRTALSSGSMDIQDDATNEQYYQVPNPRTALSSGSMEMQDDTANEQYYQVPKTRIVNSRDSMEIQDGTNEPYTKYQ